MRRGLRLARRYGKWEEKAKQKKIEQARYRSKLSRRDEKVARQAEELIAERKRILGDRWEENSPIKS